MAEKNKIEEIDPTKIIEEMREEYWRGLSEPEAAEEADRVQVLVAEVGGEKFGLDTAYCRTIIKAGTYTRVPRMPEFFLGVVNLRGEIISVIDFASFLRLPEKELGPKARLLVVEHESGRLAFRVSRVFGIEWVPLSRIQEPQTMSTSLKTEYVKGHISPVGDEGWITYLDLAKILSGPELNFQKQ